MIIVRIQGGLGNQMFQYSAGRALSLRHGTPLKFDLTTLLDRRPRRNVTFRDFDLDIFQIAGQVISRSEMPIAFRGGIWRDRIRAAGIAVPNRAKERHFNFDSRFRMFGPKTYLEGFWQSHRYFEDYASTIRSDFTLKVTVPAAIAGMAERFRAEKTVCLHVRRGDFLNTSLHEVVGADYYRRALEVIEQKGLRPRVAVFSDDIEWCRQNLKFPYETTFMDEALSGPKASYHFALMMACRAFVIPNSTFSWWAAWLNSDTDKIVIAPQKWFLDPAIDTNDVCPREWLRL